MGRFSLIFGWISDDSAFQTFRQSIYSLRNQSTEGYERDGYDCVCPLRRT